MRTEPLRILAKRDQRHPKRESRLRAVEAISRLRVSPGISSEELEREIDRARAQEIERGLTE
jgi:hypothetical protein